MRQIALPLDWPEGADGDFIVSASNAAAVAHLDAAERWPVPVTLLTGPPRSGRSLLARLYAAKLRGSLFDDADRADEEAVFHAWNRALATGRPLILVAAAPPPAWAIGLPDLASRVAATPRARLDAPDEALAGALIEKLCHARGLAAPPDLVRYLVPRIERSHEGLARAVDALDRAALERRQGLTVPLARHALAVLGLIGEAAE